MPTSPCPTASCLSCLLITSALPTPTRSSSSKATARVPATTWSPTSLSNSSTSAPKTIPPSPSSLAAASPNPTAHQPRHNASSISTIPPTFSYHQTSLLGPPSLRAFPKQPSACGTPTSSSAAAHPSPNPKK